MDETCIIELKKVNINNFKSKINSNSNTLPINNNNSISSSNQNTNPVFFYDKVSKKIIEINNKRINIYNNDFTLLEKEIQLQLNPDKLISIIVDEKLNYLIIKQINPTITANNKSKTIIILINIEKNSNTGFSSDDFDYLLGMFFINSTIFCLIYTDKIHFIEIVTNSEKKEKLEKIKKLHSIDISNKKLIKNYSYNNNKKVLFIMNTDYTIELYYLNNKKISNINKYEIKIPNINIKEGKLNSLYGNFKKADDNNKKQIVNLFQSMDKYTESQLYLEYIYDRLYFIFLSYEKNQIYIYKIENLQNLILIKYIEYNKHAHCSGLQIKDNLIILHNFATSLMVIIDIKSKNPIINVSDNLSFPYRNNLFINGEILEERRVINKNSIFLEGGSLYILKFNPEKYEKMSLEKISKNKNEIKLNKNLNRFTYNDMLNNLFNRKDTKDYILKILHKMIINKEKFMNILPFLYEIIAKMKIKIISDTNDKIIQKNDYININYISQNDIYFSLFNSFHKDINDLAINQYSSDIKINNNIIDNLLFRIILFLILFGLKLDNEKINIENINYNTILYEFIYLIKDYKILMHFINYRNIEDDAEFGSYLLEIANYDGNIYKTLFEQFGLEILLRLNKYELILDYYFKNKSISEILNCIRNFGKLIPRNDMENLLRKNKELFNKNKNIFIRYLNI